MDPAAGTRVLHGALVQFIRTCRKAVPALLDVQSGQRGAVRYTRGAVFRTIARRLVPIETWAAFVTDAHPLSRRVLVAGDDITVRAARAP